MDAFADFKAAEKARWKHFAPLQTLTIPAAARLVRHARIVPASRVLDVACGTGVVAITAARLGARATGLDLTPELLETARSNASMAAVEIDWHEGDVEKLPFESATFDAVVSQFGHMFAPRPDVATREMLRVLKPGGTIAFTTWPPELFMGRRLALIGRYTPPPPAGAAPPPLWGDPNIIRERLGTAVGDIVFARDRMCAPALSVRHFRETTERSSGPLLKLVESLSETDPAKLADLRRELDALATEYFEDNVVSQDYLMTRAVKL